MGKGTSTSSQTQQSQLSPYDPAASGMNGILGSLSSMAPGAASLNPTQSGAINQVISNSNGQPDYSAPIQSGTLGLLNGGGANNNNGAITDNLAGYKGLLQSTANGSNMGQNSALKPQLDQIATDVTNSTNGAWAAAGRDGSPGNAQALARGIAAGQAPVIANQYNVDNTNRLNAAGSLYGAGNQTYGMLNNNQQTANQNFTNGIGSVSAGLNAQNAAPTAALNAAGQQFGIPASQLQTLLGSISPVAAQFGQQNGSASGSQTLSPIQQMAMLMQGAGSMMSGGGNFKTAMFGAPG
jgi:hypothetical protein